MGHLRAHLCAVVDAVGRPSRSRPCGLSRWRFSGEFHLATERILCVDRFFRREIPEGRRRGNSRCADAALRHSALHRLAAASGCLAFAGHPMGPVMAESAPLMEPPETKPAQSRLVKLLRWFGRLAVGSFVFVIGLWS